MIQEIITWYKPEEKEPPKKGISRFFRGNVRAMMGRWVSEEEMDERRKEVLKPFYSKKFKEWF